MNGHVRKRGTRWEVVLEMGEQAAQRCPRCADARGRGRRYWTDKGKLPACPACGAEMVDFEARRQLVLPERFRTKTEAGQELTRQLGASLGGVFVEPAKMTLGEYMVDHWLPSVAGSVRASSLIAYRGHVERYIVPALGDVPLRKLTPTAINAFHSQLRNAPRKPRRSAKGTQPQDDAESAEKAVQDAMAKPLSESTRRHIHVTLVSALSAAVSQGLIAVNPASRAAAPQGRSKAEMHTWTASQLRSFLTAERDDRLFTLWRLLAVTGMRRGEALGLRWSDVDLTGGRVSIQRTRVVAGAAVLEQPPKTSKGRRAVTIDAATVAALRAWKKRQAAERLAWGAAWLGSDPPSAGWVFTRENGEPPHPLAITRCFAEAVARSGSPKIRLHDLRHTSATLALAAGLHPKVVQERLGHATIAQTIDTYSHTTAALHEGAAAELAAIMDGES